MYSLRNAEFSPQKAYNSTATLNVDVLKPAVSVVFNAFCNHGRKCNVICLRAISILEIGHIVSNENSWRFVLLGVQSMLKYRASLNLTPCKTYRYKHPAGNNGIL